MKQRSLNCLTRNSHEKSKKVIEPIENNQTKILELKNTMTIDKFNRELQLNLDQAEEIISEHKDRSYEIIQSEEQREKKRLIESKRNLGDLWDIVYKVIYTL